MIDSEERRRETMLAKVAELADARDLGSRGRPWGFESPLSHHVGAPLREMTPDRTAPESGRR